MDEQQQKVRLIIIAISGVLLLGGVGGWLMFGSKTTDETDDVAMTNTAATPGTPTNAAADPNGTAPVTPATTPAPASDPSAQAPAPDTASNPPAPANTTPVASPAAESPAASTPPSAAKPPVTPLVVKQPVASTPPAPASPAVAEQTLIASNAGVNTPPVGDSNPVASAPTPKYQFPATKRDEASAEARQVAGRKDPMQPSQERATFPMWSKGTPLAAADGDKPKDEVKVPPPPPEEKIASGAKEKLMPPPPPPSNDTNVGIPGGVDPGMLPMPPEKPTHAQFLKLTAIVGNKAVLSVPANIRSVTKWPATICLGPGERIEDANNAALSIVSVDPDSVTIDEDGERSVKSLPTIK